MPIPSRAELFASRAPVDPHTPVDPKATLFKNARFGMETIMAHSEDEWMEMAARKSLRSFMSRMFSGYTTSAHIDRLLVALELAISVPNYRLLISMPPRHSKSLHVSENLPAFYLGNNPDKRVITASHTAELAFTFSRRVRNKITDPRWPFPYVTVAGDKSAVKAWDISGHLGGYIAVGVGGSPAGHGGNLIIVDDPVGSQAEAESEASRKAVWEWYQGTLRDRLEPGGSMIITSTRWHEDDLAGHLLAEMRGGGEIWNHLYMPALSMRDGKEVALWPERWPVDSLREIKKAVGTRIWESRFQGNPTPLEGGLLRRDWWRFYSTPPRGLKSYIQSWDMAFRETKSGSFVVGQVWACIGADRYLLDQVRFRGDFPTTVQMVKAFSRKWPQTKIKLIEDKANGPAIVATLRKDIGGLVEVNPKGGKMARAAAIAPFVESGNVYLPDPAVNPWVYEFIEECASFPHGSQDDQVDAMSQALTRLDSSQVPTILPTIVTPSHTHGRLDRLGGLSRSQARIFGGKR